MRTHAPLERVYPEAQTEHAAPLYFEQLGIVTTHIPLETENPEAQAEHDCPLYVEQ